MNIELILAVLFGFVLISLIFFSRGILIFLTILCLGVVALPVVGKFALQLRWVFFILFCLHVFGDILLGRTVRRIKSFDIIAALFIIYAFLSALYSPFPSLTLERTTTILILYISVFWIIWKYAYEQGPEKVTTVVLQVMWVLLAAGYLMIFVSPHRPFLSGRFTGVFGNPNALGSISAIILPISLWQLSETRKKSALFLFLMMLSGLALSATRGSIQATVASLSYFIYVRSKKYRPLVLLSLLSFILAFIWIVGAYAKDFFMTYIRAESIPILGGRIEVWPIALDLIRDKPIFGYGFGVEDKLLELKGVVLYQHAGAYIHNSYLGILLQLGLIGFILLYLPLFILLFKEASLREESEGMPPLRYALRASLIAALVCSIYESWIYSVGNPIAFPFWVILMLLVFYRYQDREEVMPDST